MPGSIPPAKCLLLLTCVLIPPAHFLNIKIKIFTKIIPRLFPHAGERIQILPHKLQKTGRRLLPPEFPCHPAGDALRLHLLVGARADILLQLLQGNLPTRKATALHPIIMDRHTACKQLLPFRIRHPMVIGKDQSRFKKLLA